MLLGRPGDLAAGLGFLSWLALRDKLWPPPAPDSISVPQRLAMLPRAGAPVRRPVTIWWNEQQVPFINAESDEDLAAALGIVHVHLRWAQIEIMRHVSQGRIAEMVGPAAVGIDHALRCIDFGRAASAIEDRLPARTARFLYAFLAGVNHAISRATALPPEFPLLGLRQEPWSLRDLITLGRLAASDVTWLVWRALMPAGHEEAVAELLQRLGRGVPALDVEPGALVSGVLNQFVRTGSNAVAIGGKLAKTGAAWIATDTHLPPFLPNLWLLAACRSPGFHMAGLMIPGVPAVAVGRNPSIGWGGTNLHAASSELFDISQIPASAMHVRTEVLHVRGGGTRTVRIRESTWGPVISDLPLFRARGAIALRWMGHAASDEFTALLDVDRAASWQEFRDALSRLAVPGQNMLYADAAGNVGKTMAVHLPRRMWRKRESIVSPMEFAAEWDAVVTGKDLPSAFNPPEGFVASANDEPPVSPVPVGWFFSSPVRIERLRMLLREAKEINLETLVALQRDVTAAAALGTRDHLLKVLRHRDDPIVAALASWNGAYQAGSAGALAYELLMFHIGSALLGRGVLRLYSAAFNARRLLAQDLEKLPDPQLARVLNRALPAASRRFHDLSTWGAAHRLVLRHFLASFPLIGRRWRFGDWPANGGSDTLAKTANALTDRRHHSNLSSTARHISNLADPDANFFILLGGQDGWPGSTTFLDQARMWRRGEYVQVPLRPETARATFLFTTELRP